MTPAPAAHPARRRPDRHRAAAALTLAGVLTLGLAGCALTGSPDRSAAAVEPAVPLAPGATAAAGAPDLPGDPGSAGLDPELAARFAAAQQAATADGIDLWLVSGARTAEEQQQLVDQAIDQHGVPEAYRWVLPPEHSAHVTGLAIDVGPTEGTYWLVEHGLEHGLCQTYANEVWHFEMLPDGAAACPEQHTDASWAW